MTPILLALASMIVGGTVVGVVAHVRGHRASDDHEHIWSPWEDCELETSDNRHRLIPGQKRECLNCNCREVREVRV